MCRCCPHAPNSKTSTEPNLLEKARPLRLQIETLQVAAGRLSRPTSCVVGELGDGAFKGWSLFLFDAPPQPAGPDPGKLFPRRCVERELKILGIQKWP